MIDWHAHAHGRVVVVVVDVFCQRCFTWPSKEGSRRSAPDMARPSRGYRSAPHQSKFQWLRRVAATVTKFLQIGETYAFLVSAGGLHMKSTNRLSQNILPTISQTPGSPSLMRSWRSTSLQIAVTSWHRCRGGADMTADCSHVCVHLGSGPVPGR